MNLLPSQLQGRSTQTSPKGGGNAVAPLALPVVPQTVPFFELFHRVSMNSGLLTYLSVAFYPTTPVGVYVLLLDQINSPQEQDQAAMLADGDPALVTLGPTIELGSIMVFSHADCEAPLFVDVNTRGGKPITREMRGFPFDAGCIVALSSTPGILTQLPPQLEVGVPGARFTTRWQECG